MAEDTTKGESRPDSVLGSLPATRPQRLGAPRAKRAKKAVAAQPPRAAAKLAPRPAAKVATPTKRPAKKPVAVSAGCPPLKRADASEPPPRRLDPPRGAELVTTAIRAGGELTRIGLSVGGRLLKRTVDRLPRP